MRAFKRFGGNIRRNGAGKLGCCCCSPISYDLYAATREKGATICGCLQFTAPANAFSGTFYRQWAYSYDDGVDPPCNASGGDAQNESTLVCTPLPTISDPVDCHDGMPSPCGCTPDTWTTETATTCTFVFGGTTVVRSLSDPITFASFRGLVAAALPAWTGLVDAGSSAQAYMDYDMVNNSPVAYDHVSIQELQWQFRHGRGNGYIKIWYNKIVSVDSIIVSTTPLEYTWSGSPVGAEIQSTIETIDYAALLGEISSGSNVVIEIEINKASADPGFTPEDGSFQMCP